jgi:2-methylcitrate dehydratase PrpD
VTGALAGTAATLVEHALDAAESASADVLLTARLHVADAVCCAAGGAVGPLGELMVLAARADSPTGPSLPESVDLLATLIHVDEFDALHEESATCPALCVAVAVHLGLRLGSTVDQVLRAVVAGYEATVAAATAGDAPGMYARGLWPSSLFAKLGSAVTAGYLMGLDRQACAHAVAIAATSGCAQLPPDITDGHYTSAGTAARLGLEAARQAALGLVGSLRIFDDGAYPLDATTLTPAGPPAIVSTALKPYPCARPLHAVAEATRGVVEHAGLQPGDIRSITVAVPAPLRRFLNQEAQPETVGGRKCSVTYVTRAAVSGCADDCRTYWRALDLPDVPVSLVAGGAPIDDLYPRSWGARVVVDAGAATYTELVTVPLGAETRPLGRAQLYNKWEGLLKAVSPGESLESWTGPLLSADGGEPFTRRLVPRGAGVGDRDVLV